MVQQIKQIFKKFKPTNVIMEDVIPDDVKHNQKVYKVLIYLQAAVVLQLYKYQTNVQFYTASHWRSLCGIPLGRNMKRGQLKLASQKLVKAIYNIDVNDDISDAICLGIAYIKQHRSAF